MESFFSEPLITKKLLERMKRDVKKEQHELTLKNLDNFFELCQKLRENEGMSEAEAKQIEFIKLLNNARNQKIQA